VSHSLFSQAEQTTDVPVTLMKCYVCGVKAKLIRSAGMKSKIILTSFQNVNFTEGMREREDRRPARLFGILDDLFTNTMLY
jgi:hypothetical protein